MAKVADVVVFDAGTLRLWRQAAIAAMEVPGSVDPRVMAEVLLKLLGGAERLARAHELVPDALGLCTLRAMVGNWVGSDEIVLGSGDEIPRQIGRALDALGEVLGVGERVREAGAVMERLASKHAGEEVSDGLGGLDGNG